MKCGLALAGGGIRGIAHAGVIKALEELKISIDIIGGTSSGSLIGGLYAMGYSPSDIYELFKKYAKNATYIEPKKITSCVYNFIKFKKFTVKGLKTGEEIEIEYNKLATKKGIKNISDISMPLVIPAVDLYSCKEYVFTSKIPKGEEDGKQYILNASIGTAVRASSSFPIVFSPCEYEKHVFLDGGILDNIPINEVKKQGADKVIAITFDGDEVNNNSNLMDLGMKIIDIMGAKISEENIEMADEIITIPSGGVSLLDTDKIEFYYESGYKTIMENREGIIAKFAKM